MLGTRGLRPLLVTQDHQVQSISVFQGAYARDLANATAEANTALPNLDKQIAEEQATLAQYQLRLKSPAERVTGDVKPTP